MSKVPSLNGGRKVVGKNGTAAAATITATPDAASAALGAFNTACSVERYPDFSHRSTFVSPWSRFFIRGSR